MVELLLGEPVGQALELGHAVDETGVTLGHRGRGIERAVLGHARAQQATHRVARVAAQLRVGDPRLLEVEDVEEAVAEDLAHQLTGGIGARGMNGTLMPTTPATRSGCEQRQLPHDHRAPVVADEHRLLLAERVEQPDQVAGEVP